ncbi:MAG: pyridoxal-phosphate dependent enzyme [Gemmatimonadetes bacterium]|nr:pyridoxal-phosphate dependent enzyme [Gemmatimonadota bacterium]MBI3568573.1 pyridoxal-phosphate dependent enzyme [Gemmatimonadota bacterium]
MPRPLPSALDVRAAAARIAPSVVRTELRRSDALSTYLGGEVYLKLECEQRTGSFKLRGATNVIATLPAERRAAGVVTASAGNHGLGLATAAAALGIAATVYVPRSSPGVKRDKIAAAGATIDATAEHYDAAEALARADAARRGATFVSPCTGYDLLAGQGTVALEILDELPELTTIIAGVGGGGLIGGIGGFLRDEAPHVRILGAQSERTNAMALALASGEPTDIPDRPTLADGLAGLVDADMLAQGKAALDGIATVTERAIAEAIAFLWIEEGLKVEGAGAVGVAALISGEILPTRFPVAVVLSGGNIDAAVHEAVLEGHYDSL